MKLDKTSFALAAGLTGAIMSFIMHIFMGLMFIGGMMHGGMGNMPFMRGGNMPASGGCPILGWGIFIGPILFFFIAAGAGWLLAFFYNKFNKGN